MIYCGIYLILNKINNKKYVGQSVDIYRRWAEEKTRAFDVNSSEYESLKAIAFRTFGLENFEFSILENCDRKLLNSREEYWIKKMNSYIPNGYNLSKGGNSSYHYNKLTDEIVEAITLDLKNSDLLEKELAIKYGVCLDTISKLNIGARYKRDSISYPIRIQKSINYCVDCGKVITSKATRCEDCNSKINRKVERPSVEVLLKEIVESSFSSVARKYGVSDTAIKKWCISYGVPSKKKELLQYYRKNY